METNDITLQVLIDIREAVGSLKTELKTEIGELKTEMTLTRHDLGRRIDQTNRQLLTTETRLATEISALRASLYDAEPERRELRDRVERCERDIAALQARA